MFKRNIVVALALLLSSAFAFGADTLTAFHPCDNRLPILSRY